MKKLFLTITVIAVIMSSFAVSSASESGLSVKFQGTGATKGKLADMRIVISGNTELSELTLKFDYDSSALIMYEINDTGILDNPSHGYDEDDECFSLSWNGGKGNGTAAIISFMVTDEAELKKYPVTAVCEEATVISGYINVREEIPGDVDGDGELSGEDAVVLSKSAANWLDAEVQGISGDVNGDGMINLLDAIIIARSAANFEGYKIDGEKEAVMEIAKIEFEMEET